MYSSDDPNIEQTFENFKKAIKEFIVYNFSQHELSTAIYNVLKDSNENVYSY